MKQIKENIRIAVSGGKNHNAKKVFSLNIKTNQKIIFDCAEDARKYFNMKEHSPITRRCNFKIKSLYNGEWMFSYSNNFQWEEYGKGKNKRAQIRIEDLKDNKEYIFKSHSDAEKYFNFPKGTIKKVLNRNNIYKNRYKFIKCVQTNSDECS